MIRAIVEYSSSVRSELLMESWSVKDIVQATDMRSRPLWVPACALQADTSHLHSLHPGTRPLVIGRNPFDVLCYPAAGDTFWRLVIDHNFNCTAIDVASCVYQSGGVRNASGLNSHAGRHVRGFSETLESLGVIHFEINAKISGGCHLGCVPEHWPYKVIAAVTVARVPSYSRIQSGLGVTCSGVKRPDGSIRAF